MQEKLKFNWKALIKVLIYTLLTLLGILAVFKISLYLAPFLIAFALSSLLEPVIRMMMNRMKLSRKLAAVISLLLLLLTVGFLLVLLISKLVSETIGVYNMLPFYYLKFYDNIHTLIVRGTNIYVELPDEVTKNLQGIINSLSAKLMNFVNTFVSGVFNAASSIPEAIVFTLVTILSTFFLASDRDRIHRYFQTQFPHSWITSAKSIRTDMFSALFSYIRTQLIMMTITFTELIIGFWIIGVDYFVLLAFLIAIIDAFPILGTGGVLIPWAIYQLLIGDIRTGLSLLALYAIVLVVRQLVEPRVLSHQIGLHPLVTLLAMYTGLQLIGVLGLIAGPVTILLLKNILTGILKGRTLRDHLHSILYSSPHRSAPGE
jgi:sporulation integral membrane protein YtvI